MLTRKPRPGDVISWPDYRVLARELSRRAATGDLGVMNAPIDLPESPANRVTVGVVRDDGTATDATTGVTFFIWYFGTWRGTPETSTGYLNRTAILVSEGPEETCPTGG